MGRKPAGSSVWVDRPRAGRRCRWRRLINRSPWPEYEERGLEVLELGDAKSEAEEAGVVWMWPAADPPQGTVASVGGAPVIAALFVESHGVYAGRPDVEAVG